MTDDANAYDPKLSELGAMVAKKIKYDQDSITDQAHADRYQVESGRCAEQMASHLKSVEFWWLRLGMAREVTK